MQKVQVILPKKEKLKPHQSDKVWRAEAVRNAKQCANIFIEFGNAQKVARCFDDFSTLEALEHLHQLADTYRHDSQYKKAAIILEAAEIILTERAEKKETPTAEHWHQFRKPAPRIHRASPAELLTH